MIFTVNAYHLVFLSVRKVRRALIRHVPNVNPDSSIIASGGSNRDESSSRSKKSDAHQPSSSCAQETGDIEAPESPQPLPLPASTVAASKPFVQKVKQTQVSAVDKVEQAVFYLCATVTSTICICYGPTSAILLYELITQRYPPMWVEGFSVILHSFDYSVTTLILIRLNTGFREMYFRRIIPQKWEHSLLIRTVFGKKPEQL